MIDAARSRVDRDPHRRRPRNAVGRGGHDDVVRAAVVAEPAVLPDDIDLSICATSADGNGDVRRLPATPCSLTLATATEVCQVAPPSVERNERMPAPPSYGTITVPSGCTTG
jgi:hypothetical protein